MGASTATPPSTLVPSRASSSFFWGRGRQADPPGAVEGLAGPLPGFLRRLVSWVFPLPSLVSLQLLQPAPPGQPVSPRLTPPEELSPLVAIRASAASACVLHTSFHFAPGRVPYHHSETSLGQSNLGHCGDIINRRQGHFYDVMGATSPKSKGSLTTAASLLTI